MRCPNFTMKILNAKWIPAWGSLIQPGDSTQRGRYPLMCTHKFSLWFNFMCLFHSLKTNRVSSQHLVKAREKEKVSSSSLQRPKWSWEGAPGDEWKNTQISGPPGWLSLWGMWLRGFSSRSEPTVTFSHLHGYWGYGSVPGPGRTPPVFATREAATVRILSTATRELALPWCN